tara:strand:+ start:667 stop:864 length:198 start_codon:yes stop_codon:yes gene_type:complete
MLMLSSTMTGTVDQIEGTKVIVELMAKDGHTHEDIIPIWIFPCTIEEGSKFSIKSNKKNTIIRCQ